MITVLDPFPVGSGQVLTVLGAVDVEGAPALREATRALLAPGGVRVLLDLRDATALDATGAGTLLGLHHRANLSGGSLHIALTELSLLAALDRCGLTHRLNLLTTAGQLRDWGAPEATANEPVLL